MSQNSPYIMPSGHFKGGFEGCVLHFTRIKGLPEQHARRMCAYIGRETGRIAKQAGDTQGAVLARISEAMPELGPSDGHFPQDIQWMPPGTHRIVAFVGNEPTEMVVNVTADAADVLQAQLAERLAAAVAGRGDRPYLDLNHDDAEASAHPTQIYWAGDDPATGGIRAKVEWTQPGRQALAGKAYRRFSPSFFVTEAGEVNGAPVNMGGLVNQAAFTNIQPIWSRQALHAPASGPEHQKDKMDPEEQLRQAQQELAATRKELATANARIATLESNQTVKAKDAEIAALKSTVEAQETKLREQAVANAKALVQSAVKAGKLPPQATELHAKWVNTIADHPDLAATLDAIQPSPALGQVINGAGATAGASGEHAFLVRAKGISRDQNVSLADAQGILARTEPALYEAYRAHVTAKR